MTNNNSDIVNSDRLKIDTKPLRIAQLVAHEVFNDARVLKEASSAMEAGAEVKIISRALPGRPDTGKDIDVEGKSVARIPGLSFYSLIPDGFLKKLRRAAGTEENPGAPKVPTNPGSAVAKKTGKRNTLQKAVKLVKDGGYRVANTLESPLGLASWWARTVSEIKGYEPDIIHCNDANTLVPGYVAAKILKVPYVYDSHELWLHRATKKHRVIAPYVEALTEKVAVPAASAVVTVSDSIADWLCEKYKLRQRPSVVRNVPDAIEDVPGRLRDLAGLSLDDRIISFSGGLNGTRGIEIVVKALPYLPSNVHFVMLGFGSEEYVEDLHNLAGSLGVSERVHIVGPVKAGEVPGTLSDSDVAYVYLRPDCLNHKFALPNKLFEAISAGLPLVASNLPEIAKLVSTEGLGSVFDGEDPQKLAAAISGVLEAGDSYRAASERASKNLRWEFEAQGLLTIYEELGRKGK